MFLFSCSQKEERERPNTFAPKVIETKGYVVPKDSVTEPKVIPCGKPTIVKAGNPKVVPTNTNIHIAINTNIHLAGIPRVITPGQDTFLLPKTIPAIDSPFVAGIPEVVIAKDAYVKDQNPEGFSSFSKLQGLKHDATRCMLQDKSGNLWFGTVGGVSKYDGKSFTHFTEKEGLSNNAVWSMLEDKSGNLWFGTDDGVSKYDGKSFTHFTKKEGLSNNSVLSMLEDKSGNLWFGKDGGGISKYDGNRVEAIEAAEKRGEVIPQRTQQDLKRENGKLVKSFTHFTEKEGLSNNAVSMLEDKSGNLWFGMYDGGVSKYDGKSFTHFTEKEGLSNNTVWSMLEDKSGNLWFGTDGGVNKYDGNRVEAIEAAEKRGEIIPQRTQQDLKRENGKLVKSFTHFTEKEGLSKNIVRSILEDKSGNLWFGTYGGGVSKYDGKSFTHFTEKEGLSNNIVRSILEDKSGNLWFGTDGGVNKYDGKSFRHFTEKEGLSNNKVLSMLEDKSGNLWFGTYGGGVSKYDGSRVEAIEAAEKRGETIPQRTQQDLKRENGKLVKSFTHFTEKEGLINNRVWSMLEDKSGNLWFGTDGGGVSKYDGNRVEAIEAAEKRGEIIPQRTQQGLKRENGKLVKSFTHYFTEKEDRFYNIVRSILEDKSGNLWFGTYGGVSKYDGKSFTHFTEKEGLSNNTVWSILEDKSGNLWFGTNGGGVSKYDGNRVEAIEAAEKRGEIIPQRTQQGLKRVNGKLVKSFTHFTKKEGLSNNIVKSILEDKSGNLWFGTDGGVSKYDGKSFTHFTEKEGLSNNSVLSMLEDKSGNLWFGTRFGLARLGKEKLVEINDKVKFNKIQADEILFKNYTYEDGFLGIGVNGGKTICEDKNGTIWVAANFRLTAFHPQGENTDTVAPNIELTSIALFNENIGWVNLEKKKDSTLTLGNGVSVSDFEFEGITKWYSLPENLSLAYNNNYLTFNFISITQKQSKKVKYQYKLEGIDENWSAITNRTEAPYGNLPQGKYSFKVKAMNSEGYWSDEFNYTFTIRPPWWKTWWAYSIYGLLIITTVILIVWWNGRRLRVRAIELTEEVRIATVVIREEKAKIEFANVEISKQKEIVEEKHKEITDSINYALRIQQAFLPDKKEIYLSLPQSFILFKPKDIVSGDFYFFHNAPSPSGRAGEGPIFIAVVDCTGHGVPGAFMSMVGSERLTDAVQQSNNTSEILSLLNKGVKTSLKQSSKGESTRDGMDIAICSVDTKNRIVKYAGANRPMWIIGNGQTEVEEIKGTKVAIGGLTNDDQHFDTHEIKLQQGDTFYICTDGYADQFSGHDGKKLMTRKLKEILVSIQNKTMQEQEQYLDNFVEGWKGRNEQVDDILVIGIRV